MNARLDQLKLEVHKLLGALEEKEEKHAQYLQQKQLTEATLLTFQDAISLAKKCLVESLEQKKYIEEIISSGLTEVFGIKYTFVLETVLDANGVIKGLKPRLKEADGEFDDPLSSFGAGSQSIASVCFRIAILLLSSGTAKVLILDEPLANVSPTLQDRFKCFIENTCKQTGLQLIMITHMDQPFGKVYEVLKEGKSGKRISKVQEVTEPTEED
jgi:ABC-type molybdenum transport system ATPase subunit/photorepair protein PhrA